jgi:hypothetical protein
MCLGQWQVRHRPLLTFPQYRAQVSLKLTHFCSGCSIPKADWGAEACLAEAGKEWPTLRVLPGYDIEGVCVPPRPPHVRGAIVTIGAYFKGRHLRYLELNPVEGMLIKYAKQSDYPKKPKEFFALQAIRGLRYHGCPSSPTHGSQGALCFEVNRMLNKESSSITKGSISSSVTVAKWPNGGPSASPLPSTTQHF